MTRAHVLVVDEDDFIRDILRQVLSVDYHTKVAASPDEARAELSLQATDVVVLDWRFGHGHAAESLLADLALDAFAPGIVLTSTSKDVNVLGARYDIPTLLKPFELDCLLSTLNDAIVRRSRISALPSAGPRS